MLDLKARDGSSTGLWESSIYNDSRRRKGVACVCRSVVEEAVKGLNMGWMYIEIPFKMVVLRP